MKLSIPTTLILLALAGPAFAQSSHQGHGAAPPAGAAPMGMMNMDSMQSMMKTMMPAAGDAASTKDFKAADMKMMHAMAVPYTGNADVDFRTKMIPHHQGAIDMAKVALAHAKNETTKTLAAQIIKDQEREIAEMREWLRKNAPK
ncbi:CopM family metallochaperone [Bosea sp. PAMC 26642]|uniref:CopM family metallochaperone n=1 Tax=Bosea sp. (strain PAMC 26642) TaxID=1792307 RepID=UPI00077031E6|nr:DUF305 domain-containing protein [Bosea sp. PAMC 26642]AMJ63019.1 DUF305 domain-containing protein [Bosea sp. PAMC 26642]